MARKKKSYNGGAIAFPLYRLIKARQENNETAARWWADTLTDDLSRAVDGSLTLMVNGVSLYGVSRIEVACTDEQPLLVALNFKKRDVNFDKFAEVMNTIAGYSFPPDHYNLSAVVIRLTEFCKGTLDLTVTDDPHDVGIIEPEQPQP